ncbi:MAG: DUF4168 domain-containing protein [Leptolyngbyaceae cyanobacterium bins.349]|nr:DUF4168 domain-containing protein [Leptolyngbyaceae cyanobacterium bins.349]
MQYYRRLVSVILGCAVLGLFILGGWEGNVGGQPAFAQELTLDPSVITAEQRSSNRSGLDSSNIPSEKVSQFVQACLQVVTLIERREGDLQAAETEAESNRIEQEIEAAALAVIEKNGLTRQEYLQLLGLANTDPEFGERVAIQLQETSS